MGGFTVNWAAATVPAGATAVTGYTIQHIEKPASGSPDWNNATATAAAASATSKAVTGLQAATAYLVRVRASNGAGDGPWSDTAQTSTPDDVPGKVTGVTASSPTGAGFTVNWAAATVPTGAPAVSGYVVQHLEKPASGSPDWASDATSVDVGDAAARSAAVTGLDARTTYLARVAAKNASGTGAWSDTVEATTLLVLEPPPDCSGLVHHWKFNDGSDTGAADSVTGGDDGTVTGAAWTTNGRLGGALSFDGNGDFVQVGADALSSKGCGWTAALWVKRTGNQAESVLFSGPGGAGDWRVKLEQWENTHKVGFSRWPTGDFQFDFTAPLDTWVHLVLVGTNTGTTLYADGALQDTNARTVDLQLHTIGAEIRSGNTIASVNAVLDDVRVFGFAMTSQQAAALFEAVDVDPPDVPWEVTVSPGSRQLTLAWGTPQNDGGSAVTGYVVAHKLSSASDWTEASVGAAVRSRVLPGLTNGVPVDMRVAAHNAAGRGEFSATVTAAPVAAAVTPDVPRNLTVTPADKSLNLAWTAPGSDGGSAITGYEVRHKKSASAGWSASTSLAASARTYAIDGLVNSTSYDVQVRAKNIVSESGWATASGSPAAVPDAPRGLSVTPGATSLALEWQAPASDGGTAVTGYVVAHKMSSASDWTEVSVGAGALSHTVPELAGGTAYEVRVAAVNAVGWGPWASALAATLNAAPEVIPRLREWSGDAGHTVLGAGSRIVINSSSSRTSSTLHGITTDVDSMAANLQDRLRLLTGLALPVASESAAQSGDILLTLLGTRNATIGNEGYVLLVGDSVEIRANTVTGLFYGTQTVFQIMAQSDDLRSLPKGTATDHPQKGHRSVMLDLGRKYWSMEFLQDTIRRMSWHKLNILHLHFTEWSAFRLNSPTYPGLAPPEQSYSREDIRKLEDLAKAHHVVIIPEIDMPGHANAITRYYEQVNPGQSIRFDCPIMDANPWGGGTHWNINYADSTARQYARDLLSEFAPWFDSKYFHIGADETSYDANCPELVQYANAHTGGSTGNVLPHFINEMNHHVRSLGKELHIWNGYEHHGQRNALSKDVVVYPWAGGHIDFVNGGFDIVHTPIGTSVPLYLTPGNNNFPSEAGMLNGSLNTNDQVRGYQISVWADHRTNASDEFFEAQLTVPRAVLSESLWSGPSSSNMAAFRNRLATIPEPLESPLIWAHAGIPKDNWSYSASSTDGGDHVSRMFDKRIETSWRSGSTGYPHSIVIDLGDTYEISAFEYVPNFRHKDQISGSCVQACDLPLDRVAGYELFVSSDQSNWGTAIATGTFAGMASTTPSIETISVSSPASGQYVRLVATSALDSSNLAAAIAELSLFGSPVSETDEVNVTAVPTTVRQDDSARFRLERSGTVGALLVNIAVSAPTGTLSQSAPTWVEFDEGQRVKIVRLDTAANAADGSQVQLTIQSGSGYHSGSGSAAVAMVRSYRPSAPLEVTVSPAAEQLTVTWAAPENDGGSAVTGYVVEHKEAADSDWTTVSKAASARSHTIADLTNGTPYDVRVAARSVADLGERSAAVQAAPGAAATAPGAPREVTLTPGDGQLKVSWSAPGSDGGAAISGHVVEYKRIADSDWTTVSKAASARSHTIADLTNGTVYEVQVQAANAEGSGGWSTAVSAAPSATVTVPGAPRGVVLAAGDRTVSVRWQLPASDGGAAVSGYRVQHRANGDSAWSSTVSKAGTARAHTIAGLVNGTIYEVQVAAVNSAGTSVWSALTTVTLQGPPGPPQDVAATAGDAQIMLSWQAPAEGTVLGYQVRYRRTAQAGWFPAVAKTAGELTHTFEGLDNGVGYTIAVAALNARGVGTWATATATPCGLKHHWRLDETAGTTAADSVAGDDGTVTGAAWTNQGRLGGALNFDGNNDFVQVGADALDSGGCGWTAALWVKRTADLTSSALFDDANTTGTAALKLEQWNNTQRVGITRHRVADDTFSYSTPLNTWAHLAFVGTASETRLYADGVHRDTLSYGIDMPLWRIGAYTDGRDGISAVLDDIRIYAKALTATEIAALFADVSVTRPDAPDEVTLTPATGQLTVTWTAPSQDGGSAITGYTIEHKQSANTGWTAQTAAANTVSYVISDLTNETSYDVRVAAENAAGQGGFAATVTAKPSATPIAPDSPRHLTATPTNKALHLDWIAPGSDGGSAITGYIVEHKQSSKTGWSETSLPATARMHTLDNLTNAVTYDVRVAAENTTGTSPWALGSGTPSAVGFQVRGAAAGLTEPQDLTITPGDGSLALAWTAPGSDGGSAITGYVVEHRQTGAGDDAWAETSVAADVLSHTLDSLTNGTAYDVRVAAVNSAGGGVWATAGPVTPGTPDAPQDLTITPGDGSLALAWTAPGSDGGSAITGYVVEHRQTGAGDDAWAETSVAADVLSHTLDSLTNGTAYDVRVAAVNSAGGGVWATLAGIPRNVPDAPQDLTITPGDGSLALAWTAPGSDGGSAITGYVVEHRQTGAGDDAWAETSVAADVLSHTLDSLTNGTAYDVRVAAVNSAGGGVWATLAGIPRNVPDAPQDLTITPGDGSLALAWTAPGSDGGSAITGYVVEHRQTGAGDDAWAETSVAADVLSHTLDSLTNGTAYDVRVAAVNSAGGGVWATLAGIPRNVPDAPQDLTITPGDGSLALAWTAPGSDGGSAITGYVVEHRQTGAGDDAWAETSVAADVLSHTLDSLTNGTAYDVRVAAVNSAGGGVWATLAGIPRNVPDAPQDLTITPGDGSLALAWTAPGSDGGSAITGYVVEHRQTGAGDDAWAETSVAADVLSHTLDSLTNGTAYDVRVAAVNSAGGGVWATAGPVTPGTPDAPQDLTITPGDGSLALAWTAPGSDGGSAITGYVVEHRQTGAGDDAWAETSVAADVLSHTLDSLTNGTAYDVRVAAVNSAGGGVWATLAGIPRNVPDAPQDLTITPGDGSLALAWTAPGSDGGSAITGYVVEHRQTGAGDDAWAETSVAADVLSHTLDSLTNGTAYDVRVAAVNSAGGGVWATLAGIPRNVPDAPQDLTITPGDGSLALAWTAPGSDGGSAITGYVVEHRQTGAGDDAWAETSVAADVLSHTLDSLTNGTAYDVRVAAVNSAGGGVWATLAGIPRNVPDPQQPDPQQDPPDEDPPAAGTPPKHSTAHARPSKAWFWSSEAVNHHMRLRLQHNVAPKQRRGRSHPQPVVTASRL